MDDQERAAAAKKFLSETCDTDMASETVHEALDAEYEPTEFISQCLDESDQSESDRHNNTVPIPTVALVATRYGVSSRVTAGLVTAALIGTTFKIIKKTILTQTLSAVSL